MNFKDERKRFTEKYKSDNVTFVSRDQKLIDRFFTYKFENIKDALEGIIFYSNRTSRSKINKKESTQERVQLLAKEATNNATHFFRFTQYNDHLDIQKECSNIVNGIKSYKNIDMNFLQQKIEKIIEKNIQEKKIIPYQAGLYYNAREEARYKESYNVLPHIGYDDINYISNNNSWWTEDLFEAISYLKNLESSNEELYYEKWLECIIQRIKHSDKKPEQIESDLKMLNEAIEQYRLSRAEQVML